MRKLAMEKNITVAWFYGDPGHGKGTVDAMSSFGCKTPMRQAIASKDIWFEGAAEMVSFLKDHFQKKADKSRAHYLVNEKFTANLRKKKRKSYIVKQSQKCHLIAVNPRGQFTTMEHYQDQDSV